jgi:hypothetical protein
MSVTCLHDALPVWRGECLKRQPDLVLKRSSSSSGHRRTGDGPVGFGDPQLSEVDPGVVTSVLPQSPNVDDHPDTTVPTLISPKCPLVNGWNLPRFWNANDALTAPASVPADASHGGGRRVPIRNMMGRSPAEWGLTAISSHDLTRFAKSPAVVQSAAASGLRRVTDLTPSSLEGYGPLPMSPPTLTNT